MPEIPWQDPDNMGTVRTGDLIAVERSGLRIVGITHHVTTRGSWVSAEGGVVLRADEQFQILERSSSLDDEFTVISAELPALLGARCTLIRTAHAWIDITNPMEAAVIWEEGDPPLNVHDVTVLNRGVRP